MKVEHEYPDYKDGEDRTKRLQETYSELQRSLYNKKEVVQSKKTGGFKTNT